MACRTYTAHNSMIIQDLPAAAPTDSAGSSAHARPGNGGKRLSKGNTSAMEAPMSPQALRIRLLIQVTTLYPPFRNCYAIIIPHKLSRAMITQVWPATRVSRALRARSVPGASVPEGVPENGGCPRECPTGCLRAARCPIRRSLGHPTPGHFGPEGPKRLCGRPGVRKPVVPLVLLFCPLILVISRISAPLFRAHTKGIMQQYAS